MRDRKRLTRRAALGLVAGGGVLVVSGSGGFSQFSGNRSAAIGTQDDENGLIALVESNYDVVPNNQFETVANLVNNIPDDVTVTSYNISTSEDGITIRFNGDVSAEGGSLSGTIDLLEADSAPVELECSTRGKIGDTPVMTVAITDATGQNSEVTIEEKTFDLPVVCKGGPVLSIDDVRGLNDSKPFHDFQPEIDVSETNNSLTSGFSVQLTIVGDQEGTVFDQTKSAPGDFAEIQNETVTVPFNVGQLPADTYEYTVVADAASATSKTAIDSFLVDPDLLVIDLAGSRLQARTLAVDALNRSGETLDLVAVAVEHDPDNELTQDRLEFETLEIDVGLDGTIEVQAGGKNNELPGDGTRIDHTPTPLQHQEQAGYTFEKWSGPGTISGETFEVTIWAKDQDGNEDATIDRVTVP